MVRVEMEPGWEERLLAAWDRFASERLGPDIAADAQRYAPIGFGWVIADPQQHPRVPPERQPGGLRRSIRHCMRGHTLIIRADAPYAAYVELGTSPHPIDSKGPWSLWSPVLNRYFGRHVQHPGTRPRPFLRPAVYQRRHYP